MVAVYVLSFAAVHWFRAVRWRFLLRPLGEASLRSVLAVSWIAFAAIFLAPLRSGEVVRPYLITRRTSIRLWEATGTVGAERIIDGLLLSIILFVSLRFATPLDPLPDRVGDLPVPAAAVPGAAYSVLGLFAVAFAAMAVFFWHRALARRMVRAVIGVVSVSFAERLAGVVERVADGLRFLPSGRFLVPFLAETAAYWSLNAFGIWLLARGVGLDAMTFAEACVTMGCIGIGVLVPSGPGYFGAFQLSIYMALCMYFSEAMLKGPGAAFVFFLYVTQVISHVIAGVLGALLDPQTPPVNPTAPEGPLPAETSGDERGSQKT
jgi:hypothetical protein